MGVRGFWPHNMIGLEGLVVDQASKLRSLPTSHQVSPRIRDGLRFSTGALRSCGRIVLLTREHGPGDPCRLIGERDNRPIEASPRREPFQPLGTTIVALRQSKHHRAGAMNHLPSEIVIGAAAYSAELRLASSRNIGAAQVQSTPQVPAQIESDARRQPRRRALLRSRADARQLRQPPTGLVRPAKPQELLIQLVEAEIESAEFGSRAR